MKKRIILSNTDKEEIELLTFSLFYKAQEPYKHIVLAAESDTYIKELKDSIISYAIKNDISCKSLMGPLVFEKTCSTIHFKKMSKDSFLSSMCGVRMNSLVVKVTDTNKHLLFDNDNNVYKNIICCILLDGYNNSDINLIMNNKVEIDNEYIIDYSKTLL